MIITISGNPGSGKSTVAKELAKKLKLKHYSMGDFMREIAEERGIKDFNKFSELAKKDPAVDKALDSRQTELGLREDDFVIDARLGFHFIPNSIKVFLDVDLGVGAKRIIGEKRRDEKFKDEDDAKKKLKARVESEKVRYMEKYGVDHLDMNHYDIVVDTTKVPAKQVAQKIINFIKKDKE